MPLSSNDSVRRREGIELASAATVLESEPGRSMEDVFSVAFAERIARVADEDAARRRRRWFRWPQAFGAPPDFK